MIRSSPFVSLAALSSRLGVAQVGYRPQKVSFLMTLYPDGRPPQLKDIRRQQGRNLIPVMKKLPTFDTGRTGTKIQPCFLWDNAIYALGIDEDWQESGFAKGATQKKWEAFRDFHLSCFEDSSDTAIAVFQDHLVTWSPDIHQSMLQECDAKALHSGNFVFEVFGVGQLHELAVCKQTWEKVYAKTQDARPVGFCPVAGDVTPLAQEHNPIKNVRGAQATAKLVSFNENSFESYAFKRNANGAMGVTATDQYGKALNALTASDRHGLYLGPNRKMLFWVEGNAPEEHEALFKELIDPVVEQDRSQKSVAAWRDAARGLMQGTVSPLEFRERINSDLNLGSASLCVLTLSGESGRIALRDWDRSMLSEKLKALIQHREECWIEPNRFHIQPPGIIRLLRCAQSENLDKMVIKDPPVINLANSMLQAMLSPTRPYPQALAVAVLRALAGDHRANEYRCALLRGILNRQKRLIQLEGNYIPMSLERDNPDVAYVLGRLFAMVERAQEQALGNPNNTIRDSFFTSASSAPASIFPVLLHKSQHHLAQVRKESTKTYIYLEKMIGEAMDKLPPILPRTLTLQEQGTFVIGYYHQRQSFFMKQDPKQANSETEPSNE